MPFPFIPIQITLVDAFIEAYPSFLSIFESDTRRIRGSFLSTALKNAAPFALTITAGIIFISLTAPFDTQQRQTILYLLLILVSMLSVVKSCIPFTASRVFICVTMALGAFSATRALPKLFEISVLTTAMGSYLLMPYCEGLRDPEANGRNFKMKDMWLYTHAQEFTAFSPQMHKEFLLDYQKPILEKFGLSAYGCCEDLGNKIDILRSIKNLRRITVSPVANVRSCAEQIGTDYILSWRPNPTSVVLGFDDAEMRKELETGMKEARGCHESVLIDNTLLSLLTLAAPALTPFNHSAFAPSSLASTTPILFVFVTSPRVAPTKYPPSKPA